MDAIQWTTALRTSGQARLGTAMGRYLEVFTITTMVDVTDQLVGQHNQLTTEPAPTSPRA
jgi:hypothetical protein